MGGFESVLLTFLPEQRVMQNPAAAQLFHCKPRNHYVAAVFISSDVVLFMDSLNPGKEPSKEVRKQIEACFTLKKKYSLRSALVQKQRLCDCLPFAVANIDMVLSGGDVTKIRFDNRTLRSNLVKSFLNNELYFPFQKCKSRGDAVVFSNKVSK